jgi:ATP-binding cassette, subfamily B, bacterial MsbA
LDTYKKILKFALSYWQYIILSILCTIFFALLNGVSVYMAIPLLDTLFQEGGKTAQHVTVVVNSSQSWLDSIKQSLNHFLTTVIITENKSDSLLRICAFILIAFFLKNFFGYLQSFFLMFVEQGTLRDIRDAVYKHLHELPLSFFKSEKTGNFISVIINDVNVIQASISVSFLSAIREPLTILVFLGMALSISWKLTIFSLLALPGAMIVIVLIGRKLRKQIGVLQAKIADITNILTETISGVKIVKAFGMEEYESTKFQGETQGFFKLMLRITRFRSLTSPLTEIFSVVVGAVIIYMGGRLVLIEHSLKASEFLAFLLAIFQLIPPIKELSQVNNKIQEAAAAGDRVFALIDTPPMIVDAPDAKPITSFKSEIIFDNVSFKYDDSDEMILQNISFTASKGDIVAFVGPSGGGKSTLVDLMPRFYDVYKGAIRIDGTDIRKYTVESLRTLFGIVTQETILFNETISQNIAYGLQSYSKDAIIKAAKAANAHDFILELPDGYDTIIGERGLKISGGQRQRLSIARALLKNPEILIFDEATSALDNESEIQVQEAIDNLMTERTTFIIAHRLSTIRKATKIIVIEKGGIVQMGDHESLIAERDGLYKKLYEMQFREEK